MIRIGDKRLGVDEVRKIVDGGEFELDEQALNKLKANFDFLRAFSKDKVIYGINTGFGPMAQNRLEDEDVVEAQYNLIRSHAMGSGDPLPSEDVKAMMLTRLNTLMKGFSGVSPRSVHTLSSLIREDLIPYVPEHGGVGASGDLVQLAHLGLVLIGEGQVRYNGEWRPTREMFEEKGIEPVQVEMREGLAILNGTSAMTGIGLMNVIEGRRAVEQSIVFSAVINDIVAAYDDHFSEELNRVKKHKGQQRVAERMRSLLADSSRIRRRADELFGQKVEEDVLSEKVQEYYSLRCVPQILGPVLDTLDRCEEVLLDELDSVNDNPIIDDEAENVFHGGNFHGDQIAAEMDKLRSALTKTSMLADRQLNYLLNDRLNGRFPPFLNQGKLGFNFGLQGAQYTATSTVAENQNLSFPLHVHSIPSNKDNQDIVSMGTNAAMSTRKVLVNLFEVLAVHAMGIVQASGLLEEDAGLAKGSENELKRLRECVEPFVEDEARYDSLKELAELLRSRDLAD